MSLRIRTLFSCAMLLAVTGPAAYGAPTTIAAEKATCAALDAVRNTGRDSTPALTHCLNQNSPNQTLVLREGRYAIVTPLKITRAVTIRTAKATARTQACQPSTGKYCATLAIEAITQADQSGAMPIEITASGVTLSDLAIVAAGNRTTAYRDQVCNTPALRPLGGGLRVHGNDFILNRALVRGFSCYTAVEVVKTAASPVLTNNIIGPNGSHDSNEQWADGITIHDTSGAIVKGNIFRDNTDVQLILGGCRNCTVTGNRFRHSASFNGASFAELMVHGWPNSSGRYDGSVFSGNDIDCGAARNCGYGIMIGGAPWYKAQTSGGVVSNNRVSHAKLGINVDGLTGAMTISGNIVINSGGNARSECGARLWPSINIAPKSRAFAKGTILVSTSAIETTGCLLNRKPG